jgi:hypothetical protein
MVIVIHAAHMPLPIQSTFQRTRRSLDPMLRQITCIILFLFQFRIQILTSCTSQTFMLQGSHMGPTPMMPWGGSPAVEQTSTWPPPPPGGY